MVSLFGIISKFYPLVIGTVFIAFMSPTYQGVTTIFYLTENNLWFFNYKSQHLIRICNLNEDNRGHGNGDDHEDDHDDGDETVLMKPHSTLILFALMIWNVKGSKQN